MKNNTNALNVKQLSEYLGIGMNVAYRLVHQDNFPSIQIGKRIIVPKEQLDEWLNNLSKSKI